MQLVPEATDAYDQRQTSPWLFDDVQVWGGSTYRIGLRLSEDPPPPAHVTASHCVAFEGDRVVLCLHVDRQWTIPGGRLEPGESAEECLVREAREEAGIEIAGWRLVAHNRVEMLDLPPPDWPYPMPGYQLFYVARLVSTGQITATEECTEARLFSVEEALAAPGWTQDHPAFAAALLALRP